MATKRSFNARVQTTAALACALGGVAIYAAGFVESADSRSRIARAETAIGVAVAPPVNAAVPAANLPPTSGQFEPSLDFPGWDELPPTLDLQTPAAADWQIPSARRYASLPVGWNASNSPGDSLPSDAPPNTALPAAEPGPQLQLPVGNPALADKIQLTRTSDRISLTVREAPLSAVLGLIAKQHGLNIIAGEEASQSISVTLENVSLESALDAILAMHGYTWTMQQNILVVSKLDAAKKATPMLGGRLVRVYTLNYVSATDVDKIVKGLLSPVGQSFIVLANSLDQRRTSEQIVVEDVPQYVQRIEDYIREVDKQPRQVIVEAHVLEVALTDDCRHGVNFDQLLRLGNAGLTLETKGFASAVATPATTLRLTGGDLNFLIEALKTTTDAKTLASPKVTVLNGQEARIQIGGQFGYLVTTTTQTSTLESVNFLEVGVILRVTPIITDDGQVLLAVKPEVSSGGISPTTNLPESQTTEVETKVMLADGEAIVIGGLIKEDDVETQHKIPYLGDIPYLGRIFQRRTVNRERNEIVITLMPRIVPCTPGCRQWNPIDVQRAETPLFTGPLNRVERGQWEPRFKDAICRPGFPPPPVHGPPPCNEATLAAPMFETLPQPMPAKPDSPAHESAPPPERLQRLPVP